MSTLLLAISAGGLLAWAAVLAGWNAPPAAAKAPPVAPSRWRGHP